MKTPNGRFRARLANGDWFYLAGLWRPGTSHWREAFAIVTIEANPDIAPYQDRQGAVIRRGLHMEWLEGGDASRLPPLIAGSFAVERLVSSRERQRALSF